MPVPFETKVRQIAEEAAHKTLNPPETLETQAIRLLIETIKNNPSLVNAALMTKAFEIGLADLETEYPQLTLGWWKTGSGGYDEVVKIFKATEEAGDSRM